MELYESRVFFLFLESGHKYLDPTVCFEGIFSLFKDKQKGEMIKKVKNSLTVSENPYQNCLFFREIVQKLFYLH